MNLKHSIHLNTIRNARELGGYRAADGRMIKSGLLLRTARLCGISDADIATLRDDLSLGHIIDLRMTLELTGAEDPPIENAAYHHLEVIVPTPSVKAAPDVDLSSLSQAQIAELCVLSGLPDEDMYIGVLNSETGKKAYSDFLRVLLDCEPDRAVLWHCTSGKDRTGLAAMLLLFALGADEELIMRDYLLSNDYNAERIAAAATLFRERGYDEAFVRKAVLIMESVDGIFMRRAIDFMNSAYGSPISYIREGLGISPSEIEYLKAKYLI